MMKSMNKLGLYVPPAMRNPKDTETNDAAVHKTEGRKVGFAIPAPRTAVEVYKSSNRENHPPGFGPSDVDQAPSAKELPAPKPIAKPAAQDKTEKREKKAPVIVLAPKEEPVIKAKNAFELLAMDDDDDDEDEDEAGSEGEVEE